MAITQAVATSFKKQLLEGAHDFRSGGDTIKIALYTSSASLDASTTAYTTSNETSGSGYSAGGQEQLKLHQHHQVLQRLLILPMKLFYSYNYSKRC